MDRLLTRRGVMIGAGSVASLALAESAPADDAPFDALAPTVDYRPYIALQARLTRGGGKPLDVKINLSASKGMASIDITPVSGTGRMWGAIESHDPAVCEFFLELVKRIYTESDQTPDIFPKSVAMRPESAPSWLSGHWIDCPDCANDRERSCGTCGDRGCIWELWVTK